MKNIKIFTTVLALFMTSSCNSNLTLNAVREDKIIDIKASIQEQNNSQIIKVLPDTQNKDFMEMYNSKNLEVIYNNGRNTYPVKINSDKSLDFPFTNDLTVDSNGDIKAIVTIESKYTKLIDLIVKDYE